MLGAVWTHTCVCAYIYVLSSRIRVRVWVRVWVRVRECGPVRVCV